MKSKTQRGQQTQSSRIPQQSKSDHKVDRDKSDRERNKTHERKNLTEAAK